MSRSFTQLWRHSTFEAEEGLPLHHSAGNELRSAGVQERKGHRVYIVGVWNGSLHLGGRLRVDKVFGNNEAQRRYGPEVWEARDHIAGRPEGLLQKDLVVPAAQVRRLRFVSGQAPLMRGRRVDQQTFRGVRELTTESARILDQLLGQSERAAAADDSAEDKSLARRPDLKETVKTALRKYRCAQGIFRDRVMQIESKCRVTGVEDMSLLRASHIKPWSKSSNSERQDGHNGLMLAPHVDALFDQGLISFSNRGDLLIARALSKTVLRVWGIRHPLNVGSFSPRQQRFLVWHRRTYGFPSR